MALRCGSRSGFGGVYWGLCNSHLGLVSNWCGVLGRAHLRTSYIYMMFVSLQGSHWDCSHMIWYLMHQLQVWLSNCIFVSLSFVFTCTVTLLPLCYSSTYLIINMVKKCLSPVRDTERRSRCYSGLGHSRDWWWSLDCTWLRSWFSMQYKNLLKTSGNTTLFTNYNAVGDVQGSRQQQPYRLFSDVML